MRNYFGRNWRLVKPIAQTTELKDFFKTASQADFHLNLAYAVSENNSESMFQLFRATQLIPECVNQSRTIAYNRIYRESNPTVPRKKFEEFSEKLGFLLGLAFYSQQELQRQESQSQRGVMFSYAQYKTELSLIANQIISTCFFILEKFDELPIRFDLLNQSLALTPVHLNQWYAFQNQKQDFKNNALAAKTRLLQIKTGVIGEAKREVVSDTPEPPEFDGTEDYSEKSFSLEPVQTSAEVVQNPEEQEVEKAFKERNRIKNLSKYREKLILNNVKGRSNAKILGALRSIFGVKEYGSASKIVTQMRELGWVKTQREKKFVWVWIP